ncbi:unnamed protein product [Aphanomyces euteiches]|nr:hypothetical protein AeRB84_013214 [Aphanomyces euteiches]
MHQRTHPEAKRHQNGRPSIGASPKQNTFAQRTSRMLGSILSADNDAQRLARKMAYYSTMRIRLRHVQFALEAERRTSFYKELAVYLVFLLAMVVAICAVQVQIPFEHNDGLYTLYFANEFPNVSFKKTFQDVGAPPEMWQWLNGVLLPAYYNSTQRNSYRVSSIQIRFGQVQAMPCRVWNRGNTLSLVPLQTCFPAFENGIEDTTPFGDQGDGTPFVYERGLSTLLRSLQATPDLWNSRMDYGSGGYTVYIPRDNATAGQAMMDALSQNLLTPGTRYVAATWALYNPSTDALSHLQALFEISAADRFQVTSRIGSFHVQGYVSIAAFFTAQNLLMLFLGLVTLGFTYRQVRYVGVHGAAKYFESLWNYLDMIQLVCLYAFVAAWFAYLWSCHDLIPTLQHIMQAETCADSSSGKHCFVDLTLITQQLDMINNLGASLALVSAAIVFKYLRLNTRLNMLWETLRLAALDLVAFVFIFMFIFFGYSIMGFLLFGAHSSDYRSLSDSLASCFQMLLGAFDYGSLSAANPVMSGVFFFSFMILVFLIVINMFVAILSEYYTLAQAAKRKHDEMTKKLLLHGNYDGSDLVEYDILKQIVQYFRGLQFQVQLNGETIPLLGDARVLLVDHSYLLAERGRLRAKFHLAILVVRTCLRWFPRHFDSSTSSKLHDGSNEARLGLPSKAKAIRHLHYAKFPVTFIPLYSKSAVPITMLEQLQPGMCLDLDDGSLTCDRISLQVLGPQEIYLDSDNNGDDEMDKVSADRRLSFGLHHVHPDIGSGNHIKCCRVVYHGEIVLTGQEACLVSRLVWCKYVAAWAWRGFKDIIAWRPWIHPTGSHKNRVIADDDLDDLVSSLQLPDENQSCRFDELVKQLRHFIAKRARQGSIRVPGHDLEACVTHEAIAFVERFPNALVPLDKRELVGYKYVPTPTDTTAIRLPNSVARLSEFLAQNVHEVWSASRIAQGWQWGPHRDNEKKLHPDLVAYSQLSDNARQYDRDASVETLKTIIALGYAIHPKSQTTETTHLDDLSFGLPAPAGETYVPRPIATAEIELSSELKSLVELLAENSHDVWSKKRMEEGWVYGPKSNDATKEHDGLVPYVYLTAKEKDMDRNTAVETVKCILRCGFTFEHKRENAVKKFSMFGHRVAPIATNAHHPKESEIHRPEILNPLGHDEPSSGAPTLPKLVAGPHVVDLLADKLNIQIHS